MVTVESLWVYPIKSCQGVSLDAVGLTASGFETDRGLMLVDMDGRFVTQRESLEMSRVRLRLADGSSFRDCRWLLSFEGLSDLLLDVPSSTLGAESAVSIWRDECLAREVLGGASEWFSEALRKRVRLMVLPRERLRRVDPRYGREADEVGFADGYPALMIGSASVADLSQRAGVHLATERFRPNLVLGGLRPFEEDELASFRTPHATFYGVKPCARCVITTIEPTDHSQSKEPLRTLSAFRRRDGEVYFGMNLVFDLPGELRVGDPVEVLSRVPVPIFD